MEIEDEAKRLRKLIYETPWFIQVLEAVRSCDLPDWYVGGGVIRTLVWDHLHEHSEPTPMRDIDVAYFAGDDLRAELDELIEGKLWAILPDIPWQVKNQAAVHLWYKEKFGYGVEPLASTEDGIATFPEYATSVGVRLLPSDEILLCAPYGLADLFHMVWRRNPRRVTQAIFIKRFMDKQIQTRFPKVRVLFD